MLKKLLGIAPKLEPDNSYSPSRLALKLATSDTTDFENTSYTKYQGKKSKILVIFTEQLLLYSGVSHAQGKLESCRRISRRQCAS